MYLCMTEITLGQKIAIAHGKALPKDIAENNAKYSYRDPIVPYRVVSWVARADTPHKCDVQSCILNRVYLKNKMRRICEKLMLYEECKKFLYTKVPNDIITYIMEKCFCKKQIKFNN